MKKLASAIALLLALPAAAHAIGIQGSVFKSGSLPVYPCDIDIWDRVNNVFVITNSDTTLPNGSFNLVLPNGRYDLTFKPGKTSHLFQGFVVDARVNNNTLFFNVPLATGVYVSGRVLGPDNVGVNFTNLRLRNALGAAPNNIQDNNTNPDGTFKLIVDPGTWDVGLVPALTTHRAPVEIPAVNCSGDVVLGDIHVPLGVVMTCTVTDPSLFPVSGAAIAVRTNPGRDRVFVPNNNTTGAGSVQICLAAGHAYDICANPPAGLTTTYATWSQYGVLADVDKTLPNFALPAGRQLSAHVVGGPALGAVVSADLDVDWMQAPLYPRVETPGDITNALGNFAVTVGNGLYRVTVNPPVATKLLPVRIPNVSVGAAGLNMGTITCPTGHWVDITVVTQGTNVPVLGANIDLDNIATGTKLITVGDVTNASGFARIVSDQALYTLKISPPNSTLDTAYFVGGFRTLSDTAITVVMPRKGVLGVGDRAQASLELAAPWPNPARGGVSFAFKGRGAGTLEILDLAGRRIATPWQGDLAAATTVRWDGHDASGREVPGGMYFARLRTDAETRLRRVVWVK